MFNKRHYEAIALLLQDLCPELPQIDGEYDDDGYDHDALGRQLMWDDIRDAFAYRLFTRDNSRFQSERFRAACQPRANVKLRTRYKVVNSPSG